VQSLCDGQGAVRRKINAVAAKLESTRVNIDAVAHCLIEVLPK
jgi:hypothetical protein